MGRLIKTKGPCDGPPTFHSHANVGGRHARSLSPVSDAQGFATVRDHVGMAAVSDLPAVGGPPAVAGFVIPIVVDAVDGHAVRLFPHVGQEVFKPAPTITDGDSTPPVIREILVLRAQATSAHPVPNAVGFAKRVRRFFGGVPMNELRHVRFVQPMFGVVNPCAERVVS